MMFKSGIKLKRAIEISKVQHWCPICNGKLAPVFNGHYGDKEELIRQEYIHTHGVEPIFTNSRMELTTPDAICTRCGCETFREYDSNNDYLMRVTFRAEKRDNWWIVFNVDEKSDKGGSIFSYEILTSFPIADKELKERIENNLAAFINSGVANECYTKGNISSKIKDQDTIYWLNIEKDNRHVNISANEDNYTDIEPFPFFAILIQELLNKKNKN